MYNENIKLKLRGIPLLYLNLVYSELKYLNGILCKTK